MAKTASTAPTQPPPCSHTRCQDQQSPHRTSVCSPPTPACFNTAQHSFPGNDLQDTPTPPSQSPGKLEAPFSILIDALLFLVSCITMIFLHTHFDSGTIQSIKWELWVSQLLHSMSWGDANFSNLMNCTRSIPLQINHLLGKSLFSLYTCNLQHGVSSFPNK